MLKEINFTKMHTNGNDYIIIDGIKNKININFIKSHIKEICENNFGIGAKGVALIMPSTESSAEVFIYNSDSSETFMSGGAILNVARYLYDNKLVKNKDMSIKTKSGIKNVHLSLKNGEVSLVSLKLGNPKFSAKLVPVLTEKSVFINETIHACNNDYQVTCVSVGNPHAIIYTNNLDSFDLDEIGKYLSTYYLFPERINVSAMSLIDKDIIRLKTFERGAGRTLSCITAASSAVSSAVINDYLKQNKDILVLEDGGSEIVNFDSKEGIVVSGTSNYICHGKILK